MILLELFFTFARIGLFTFGGGYGMLPLIQQEVTRRGWLDAETLYSYVGICESTPGPIAVNMATFVGASQAGLLGSLCATLGVVLPSFVVILLIAAVLKDFRQNRYVQSALAGVRPVVAGMILATGLCLFLRLLNVEEGGFSVGQILIAVALGAFAWVRGSVFKRPFSPIAMILFSAVCGIVIYGW